MVDYNKLVLKIDFYKLLFLTLYMIYRFDFMICTTDLSNLCQKHPIFIMDLQFHNFQTPKFIFKKIV